MLLFIAIYITFGRRVNQNTQEIQIGPECFIGSKDDITMFLSKYHIDQFNIQSHQNKNCSPLKQLWTISDTFTYGNWCGKSYGGFNNNCKELCEENFDEPTEECKQCNPPIDWVDEQCMYHDFCMTRFETLNIGYGQACSDSINLGNPFPSPCSCAQNLTQHLRLNYIILHCGTNPQCLLNGQIINNFFDSDVLKCSCTYTQCNNNTIDSNGNFIDSGDKLECWNSTACLNVEQCTGLNGK